MHNLPLTKLAASKLYQIQKLPFISDVLLAENLITAFHSTNIFNKL